MARALIFYLKRRTAVSLPGSRRNHAFAGLCVLTLLVQTFAFSATSQGLTGSIKGTVSATAADPSARPSLIPAARLSLVNRDIQGAAVKIVTDEAGNFAFLDLPAANYTLTAEADGLPVVKQDIRLTTGAALVVEIVLTATVTASVTVRQEEGLLGTAETTTSNTVRRAKAGGPSFARGELRKRIAANSRRGPRNGWR